MHPTLGVIAALVGAVAFYWTASNAVRVLRQRNPAVPKDYILIALGLAGFVAIGGPGFGFLLERWRERGAGANRLLLAALPLGFAYGVFWGLSGVVRRRIVSRTGVLTGRNAVEYGALMALLAAIGLALTAPLFLM